MTRECPACGRYAVVYHSRDEWFCEDCGYTVKDYLRDNKSLSGGGGA